MALSDPERQLRIRELQYELAKLRTSNTDDSGLRVAQIVRELVELSKLQPAKD